MRELRNGLLRGSAVAAALLVAAAAEVSAQYSITATAVVTESLTPDQSAVQLQVAGAGLTADRPARGASRLADRHVLRRTIVTDAPLLPGGTTPARATSAGEGTSSPVEVWIVGRELERRRGGGSSALDVLQAGPAAAAVSGSGMRRVIVTRVVAANS